MKQLTLLQIEWNNWNGFIFSFIGIEYGNFDSEFLGLNFSKDFLIISICFIRLEIKGPTI